MGHAQTASSSPRARDERRERDDAQRETVYRLLWLASLRVFPSEDQYARRHALFSYPANPRCASILKCKRRSDGDGIPRPKTT
jgi:hypothetical protein